MSRVLLNLKKRYKKNKRCIKWVNESGKNVLDQSDNNTLERLKIGDRTSTEFLYDMWEISRNNALFKKLCIECGLPTPKWYHMTENIDPITLDTIIYPVVVKPVEVCDDKYVFICHREEELFEGYNLAIGFSKSRKVVVEEFVKGVIFSSPVYVNNGSVHCGYSLINDYLYAIKKMVDRIHILDGKFILHGIINEDGCSFTRFELIEWGKHSA